jgi:hypothetical protein
MLDFFNLNLASANTNRSPGRGLYMTSITCFSMLCAWACNVAALGTCRFVDSDIFFENVGGSTNIGASAVGLFTFESASNGVCYTINWDDWSYNFSYWTDYNLNVARGTGGTAGLLGFIFLIVLLCAMCCSCARAQCVWMMNGIVNLICAALAGCMFFINKSYICESGSCEFSTGGALTVTAIVMYFITAVLCFSIPRVVKDEDDEPLIRPQAAQGGSNVTEVRTEHADGTVTVKTTTTHPDGTQTIEETTTMLGVPDEQAPGVPDDIESMPKAQVG